LDASGLCLLLSIGCGGNAGKETPLEDKPTVLGDRNAATPTMINVEGCLTSSGDRFVLTKLQQETTGSEKVERGASGTAAHGGSTTESYRLVGMDDQLRPLVGQRVRIAGDAQPEQVVDVREQALPTESGNRQATGTSGARPQVSSVPSTHLAISDLRVNAVTPTGERCEAGSSSRSRPKK